MDVDRAHAYRYAAARRRLQCGDAGRPRRRSARRLFALVLALGAMLAGFAGAMAAPIVSVEPGMGGSVLILAFVVIVLGGTGSVNAALVPTHMLPGE